jgi:hypothetical protein
MQTAKSIFTLVVFTLICFVGAAAALVGWRWLDEKCIECLDFLEAIEI